MISSTSDANSGLAEPSWQAVLDFWFGVPGAAEYGTTRKLWFEGTPQADALIAARFGALHAQAIDGALATWGAAPLSACALIIVLDQFSRNLYRGNARAFAGDAQALALARRLVARGDDRALPTPYHRWFVYMPFEHDEAPQSQRESLRLFGQLAEREGLAGPLAWARRHADVIARFGRYPHRNAVLGRASSDEELQFLAQPGSSF